MLNEAQKIEFYAAGIKDANEARSITTACKSERYKELSRKYHLQIGSASIAALDNYNAGVAYEINRQTRLEF